MAGVGWRGLAAVVCAGVGALAFLDFQPGLRHAAAAVLIFCANTAFCPSRLYRHPRFRPTAAVCAAALAWHIASGVCFLVMLLQGVSYNVPILTYNLW